MSLSLILRRISSYLLDGSEGDLLNLIFNGFELVSFCLSFVGIVAFVLHNEGLFHLLGFELLLNPDSLPPS